MLPTGEIDQLRKIPGRMVSKREIIQFSIIGMLFFDLPQLIKLGYSLLSAT